MENQDKFSTFDRALLAICVIVVLACAFLMMDGRFLFGGDDTSKLQAVGEIENSRNDVRQKHQTGFSWRGVDKKDTVFEGDSIFTGDTSQAKVKFKNGGELAIDPKSLVVIRTNNGALELDLRYGAFSGKLADDQKLILIKDGERQEVTGKGAEIRITEKKIEVVKGKISVRQPASTNKPAVTKVEEKKFPIALKTPANNVPYWNGEIEYSWTDAGAQGPYTVEFSAGASFKSTLAEVDSSELTLTTSPNFEGLVEKGLKKEFFWRVRSKAKPTVVSQSRKVTIFRDEAPALTFPAHEQIFLLDPEKEQSKTVGFSWTDPSLSQNYSVQIARDEQFNELLTSQNVSGKEFQTSALKTGSYYWRVQGNHPLRKNSPWSETRKLSVVEKVKVVTPKVLARDEVYVLPLKKVVKNNTNSNFEKQGVPVTDYPTYSWNKVEGATGYRLEVARDRKFEKFKKVDFDNSKDSYQFKIMKPGMLGWRVRAASSSTEYTQPTKPVFVRTDLPPPPAKKPVLKNEDVLVSWTPLIFARYYEVQWAGNESFNLAKSNIAPNPSQLLAIGKNKTDLYWRVRALDEAKRPLSAFTESQLLKTAYVEPPKPTPLPEPVQQITATPTPEPVRKVASVEKPGFVKPILREPRAKTSVISFDKAPVFLNFKWSKLPAVKNYRIELSQSPDFASEPLFSDVTSGNELLFQKRLPAGDLYWRVRGESTNGDETPWSDPAPLSVRFK